MLAAPRRNVKMVDLKRVGELNQALLALHFAFREVIEEPDKILAKRGLGRVHHRVLFFIAQSPGLRVGELVAALAVSKQALHQPLQQLVRAGLVAAAPSPASGRVKLLRLTPAGAALEDRLSGIQRARFAAAFAAAGITAEKGWRAVMRELARR
jgi:DNA-binding MarR family transcriptional regulator